MLNPLRVEHMYVLRFSYDLVDSHAVIALI